MSERPAPPTREERLAARLRDNLRRRKDQARALARGEAAPGGPDAPESAGAGAGALPKAEPNG